MKTKKPNKEYVKRAQRLLPEIQKTFDAVSRCLNESELFPIYLVDLQDMVDSLMYLNVAHNVVLNAEHNERLSKLEKKKTRKANKKI